MNILFAAPENAWGGFFASIQSINPEHHFVANGKFQIESLAGFDVVLPTMSPITAKILETADQLKLIQQVGAGLEGVDINAATRAGIHVANVPSNNSGNAVSVAEVGIYLMIGLARDAREMHRTLQDGRIGSPLGLALAGKRAGIIGLGGIGEALTPPLQALGMDVIGVKKGNPQETQHRLGLSWCGTMTELPYLLGSSDFVILALPDNSQTHHLMNLQNLKLMKPESFLINLGRGGLIPHADLLQALRQNLIAGAGLDVFWNEPPNPKDEIFKYNVLATPHIAGATDLSLAGIRQAVCENLRRLADHQPILNCVN
jgi:phosphoglycerate dehydrogenase-like enzyme